MEMNEVWPDIVCSGVLTLVNPLISGLYPTLGLNSLPIVVQFPPADAGPWLLIRSELSGYWEMYRYYIYNKYFVNKLTTIFLYQKGFINNNIINKIRRMYWFK